MSSEPARQRRRARSDGFAIQTEGLGKRYLIGRRRQRYATLRESITRAALAPLRRVRRLLAGEAAGATDLDRTIWALRDVDLEVGAGEVVGIIGRNGAGKTTLLKILSRITEPSAGWARIRGRVGSLLEVGTGFHPELTGRENIYLNGAILGMRRTEIERKFDAIVDFAEVERFIDTPVKFYSSGMYVRLAFAVAAHLEPEILLVDEVLAVGDASFQRKCLSKMGGVSRQGRTILFVSHNLVAIQNLCDRVVWLDEGSVRLDGPAAEVVAAYMRSGGVERVEQTWDDPAEAPGNEVARLRRVAVEPAGGEADGLLRRDRELDLVFEFWSLRDGTRLDVNFHLLTQDGAIAFASGTVNEPDWHGRPHPAGLYRSRCRVPAGLLNVGPYDVRVQLVRHNRALLAVDRALSFEVRELAERRGSWLGRVKGAVRPQLEWRTEAIDRSTVSMDEVGGA